MSAKNSKGSVIIVEDDMLLSLVQSRMIEKLGYDVVAKAVSGEDAVEKVRELQPDAVVMDISLKGPMDGIDAMEEIRTFSDVSVIYLSGNSDKQSLARARKTLFTEFLVKPITADQLAGPLESAVNPKKDEMINQAS
ncbi:MAG: response regulator [Balneolaceae bacterium]|nr:response regulator [Balneolaceae bacterium]MCH8548872.1 response regulator [Balneolaceae bacterium]